MIVARSAVIESIRGPPPTATSAPESARSPQSPLGGARHLNRLQLNRLPAMAASDMEQAGKQYLFTQQNLKQILFPCATSTRAVARQGQLSAARMSPPQPRLFRSPLAVGENFVFISLAARAPVCKIEFSPDRDEPGLIDCTCWRGRARVATLDNQISPARPLFGPLKFVSARGQCKRTLTRDCLARNGNNLAPFRLTCFLAQHFGASVSVVAAPRTLWSPGRFRLRATSAAAPQASGARSRVRPEPPLSGAGRQHAAHSQFIEQLHDLRLLIICAF